MSSEPETANLPPKPDPGPLPFHQAAWPHRRERQPGQFSRRDLLSDVPAITRLAQDATVMGRARDLPSFSVSLPTWISPTHLPAGAPSPSLDPNSSAPLHVSRCPQMRNLRAGTDLKEEDSAWFKVTQDGRGSRNPTSSPTRLCAGLSHAPRAWKPL